VLGTLFATAAIACVRNLRLILWNRQYEELYSLQGRLRVGMRPVDLMRHRFEVGTLDEDPLAYAARAEAAASSGQELKHVFKLPDGRVVAGSNRPRPDGGWGSTHEDVTDREVLEHQRSSLQREQARRDAIDREIGNFRSYAATLLEQVNASAEDMRSIATNLLGSARNASSRVTDGVVTFQQASSSFPTAAWSPARTVRVPTAGGCRRTSRHTREADTRPPAGRRLRTTLPLPPSLAV
jgi:hypothetical protein